jgi:polar amino acid transport system substrate-binding protein
MILGALKRNKSVFVEKPLCMNREELEQISAIYRKAGVALMVGFNRRFAPFVEKIKEAMKQSNYPFSLHYRINAGFIPGGTWIQDADSGGGRIIGEVCHFVDLLSYLTDSKPVKIAAESLTMPDDRYRSDDNLQIMIRYADGSVGTINYVASGNKSAPKEYLEIFGGGMAITMDDFTSLRIIDSTGKKTSIKSAQNKGHRKMLELWSYYLQTGLGSPIMFDQIINSTRTTFDILDSLAIGEPRWVKP